MFNLFDVMRQAQGGAGLDNMARQFGLPPAQGQAAVAAFLPALVMAFQRAALNPAAMAEIMAQMSRAPYEVFFQSATHGFSLQARREGDQMLERLFGSPEVSRAVAQQSAAFSGLGAEMMRQMMPIIAAMVVGGLLAGMRAALEQARGPWPAAPDAYSQGAPPAEPFAAVPWPWADFFKALAPPTPPAAPRAAAPPPTPLEEMMGLFLAGLRPFVPPPPEPPPPPPPAPAPPPSPMAAWSAWMEAGQEMQRQHLAALQALVDGAWGGSSKGR